MSGNAAYIAQRGLTVIAFVALLLFLWEAVGTSVWDRRRAAADTANRWRSCLQVEEDSRPEAGFDHAEAPVAGAPIVARSPLEVATRQKRQCLHEAFVAGTAPHEHQVYSQINEDGIIAKIWECITPDDQFYVEFGVENGTECTTRNLHAQGWSGLLMDGGFENPDINLQKEFFTAENIADLFAKYSVPKEFDHLTIDIDQNTFWVLQALLYAGYRPRVIVAEINRNFHPKDTFVVPYHAPQMWDETMAFGAAPGAYDALFEAFGYHTLGIDQVQVNAYAVRSTEIGDARVFSMDEITAGIRDVPLCVGLHACLAATEWLQVDYRVAPLLVQARADWYGEMPRWKLACSEVEQASGANRIVTGKPFRGADAVEAPLYAPGLLSTVPCGTVAAVTAAAERLQVQQQLHPDSLEGHEINIKAPKDCPAVKGASRSMRRKHACLYSMFLHGTQPHEVRQFSQLFEDGIIDAIFDCIVPRDKYYVEFGVETGIECTTRHLRERGWTGLLMDGGHKNATINLQMEFFTAENIAGLFEKYSVPKTFDHMTIDIDQNTFWVLHAVLAAGYRPRVIVAESNSNFHPFDAFVVPYDSDKMWDETMRFGASAGAYARLFEAFGYHVVGIDQHQVNVYAVHSCEVGQDPVFTSDQILSGLQHFGPCLGLHQCAGMTWLNVDDTVSPLLTHPRVEWYDKMPRWNITCSDVEMAEGAWVMRLMSGKQMVGEKPIEVPSIPAELLTENACGTVLDVTARAEQAE